eukprot:356934-Chlamydomonas_euryale.AAC.5
MPGVAPHAHPQTTGGACTPPAWRGWAPPPRCSAAAWAAPLLPLSRRWHRRPRNTLPRALHGGPRPRSTRRRRHRLDAGRHPRARSCQGASLGGIRTTRLARTQLPRPSRCTRRRAPAPAPLLSRPRACRAARRPSVRPLGRRCRRPARATR